MGRDHQNDQGGDGELGNKIKRTYGAEAEERERPFRPTSEAQRRRGGGGGGAEDGRVGATGNGTRSSRIAAGLANSRRRNVGNRIPRTLRRAARLATSRRGRAMAKTSGCLHGPRSATATTAGVTFPAR